MRSDLLPVIISITTFLLIYNIFCTIIPYPFAIAIDEINRFCPKAYTHPADQPENLITHTGSWKGYKVIEYWYYWGYDGHDVRPDWEPVILLVDERVRAVAVRMHYSWRVALVFPVDDLKPVVMFALLYHTPYLKEPPEDWTEVTIKPNLEQPPEKLDYDKIFGFAFTPTESAIAAALIFGGIGGAMAYVASRLAMRR